MASRVQCRKIGDCGSIDVVGILFVDDRMLHRPAPTKDDYERIVSLVASEGAENTIPFAPDRCVSQGHK
jgi:hypothetical protein